MTMRTPTDEDFAAHLATARTAWPSLSWDDHDYRGWLRAQVAELGDAVSFASINAGSAVLCWCAGKGDSEAHKLFDLHYMSHVAPALARFNVDRTFIDEIEQRLRVKLLIAKPGELAPIAKYGLRGSVAGLIRVAATREALNAREGDKPTAPIESLEEMAGETDPALRALKVRYAADFERAFSAAVRELPVRDRQLLRLSLSVNASIDDIARMFQTHRATAARWLNSARDALAAGTRQKLQDALGLPDDELTSLLRLVRTEATRMLASIPPESDE